MGNKKYTADDIRVVKSKGDLATTVDLSRKAFGENMLSAARHALEFARTLVVNDLPDKLRYVVYLGASYDGNPLEDREQTFPDDYADRQRCFFDSDEVVELLWREGKVPEWINVSVESEDGEYTLIRLECCGRYSDDVNHIYHAHEGRAPFQVLGPPAPPDYGSGGSEDKYDLYWNKG